MVDQPSFAGAAPGAAVATVPASIDPATVESPRSIAVKLAPGSRLATKADGTLTVVQDWASLATTEVRAPGLALEQVDSLDSLEIEVLQPASTGASGQDAETDVESAARLLRLMPGVLWAEVSYPMRACLVPDDPLYLPGPYSSLGQWGLQRVGFPLAWDTTTGSANVTLAVIDTGINRAVGDFSGRIVSAWSVLSDSAAWPAWEDHEGHGTAVAGIAAAQGNDGQGIAGAAWNVGIMPVKISDMGDSDTTTLARGIEYAVDHGADVINISFATLPGSGYSSTLASAVDYAVDRGVLVVAAAGNDGGSSVRYPAALPGVIAVGATDNYDARWAYSGGGSNTGTALDLVAPGRFILIYNGPSGTSFDHFPGTSLSSPLVAGAAALLLSVDPTLTPEEMTDILTGSADDLGAPGWDEEYGWGLLDADEAVAQVADDTTTTTTTTDTSTTTTTTSSSTTTTTTSSTTSTTVPRFADVSEESTPYSQQIDYLASLGVVSGSSNGLFYPNDGLMRQQFAKMIVLTLHYPVSPADVCLFGDVAESSGAELYPDHYVAVAYQRGLTKGTDATHFSPYRTLSRAQMVTMVARAAGLPQPPIGYVPPFSNFSSVHYPYARAAAYAGLLDAIVGMGSSYDFLAPATRGEVCALLYVLVQ